MPLLRRGWDRLIPLQLSPRARQRRLIFAREMGRTARARCTENAEIEQKGSGNRNFDFRKQWSRDKLYGWKSGAFDARTPRPSIPRNEVNGSARFPVTSPCRWQRPSKKVLITISYRGVPLFCIATKPLFPFQRASKSPRVSFNGHDSRHYVKLISRRGYLLSIEYRNYPYATFWLARVLLSWLRCAIRAT